MSQHFLLSSAAKSLSLSQVFRLTDLEAETAFRKVRWHSTKGQSVCPHCGGLDAYECRRSNGSLRFRCKACAKDFTITSAQSLPATSCPCKPILAQLRCSAMKSKASQLWLCPVIWAWHTKALLYARPRSRLIAKAALPFTSLQNRAMAAR